MPLLHKSTAVAMSLAILSATALADGSKVLLGQLFVDADGAPKAYHRNEAVALDNLVNAVCKVH